MSKLDANLLSLRVGELDSLAERFDLRVFPEAAVFGSDTTFRDDSGRLNEGEAGAALDDATEVGMMPCSVVTIFGRVLAKWGDLYSLWSAMSG